LVGLGPEAREQVSQAILEVLLQLLLVRQQTIQPFVETSVVHLGGWHANQIFQRRVAVPVLCDVEFARRLTETRQHQDAGNHRPGHIFLPAGQVPVAELIQPQNLPQLLGQQDVAKLAAPLEVDLIDPNLHRLMRNLPLKQTRLRRLLPKKLLCQQRCPRPSLRIQFSEVRDDLLANLTTAAHRAHQAPVRVLLAALPSGRPTQVHCALPTTG
jgi:hypothetical protein